MPSRRVSIPLDWRWIGSSGRWRPSGMNRPPYKEEGILGPGGRKFIGLGGRARGGGRPRVVALNVDFGELADEIEELGNTTTNDEPTGGGGSGGGDGWNGGEGSSGGDEASSDEPPPSAPAASPTPSTRCARRSALIRSCPRAGGAGRDQARRAEWQRAGRLLVDRQRARQLQFAVVVALRTASSRPVGRPGSLGRLLEGAKRHNRGRDLEVVNAILARDLIESKLQWVPNEQAPNGANLTFKARPSGRAIQQIGGTGAPGTGLPPQTQRELRDAQRRSEVHRERGRRVQRDHEVHGAVPAVASAAARCGRSRSPASQARWRRRSAGVDVWAVRHSSVAFRLPSGHTAPDLVMEDA